MREVGFAEITRRSRHSTRHLDKAECAGAGQLGSLQTYCKQCARDTEARRRESPASLRKMNFRPSIALYYSLHPRSNIRVSIITPQEPMPFVTPGPFLLSFSAQVSPTHAAAHPYEYCRPLLSFIFDLPAWAFLTPNATAVYSKGYRN